MDALSASRTLEVNMNMTLQDYARLAAIIFSLAALAQLARAFMGVSMMAGSTVIPVWVSWIAFLVFAGLAWLGFSAKRM
jgi:protein-S-isoprenylcysteine O-methyltransferase Ste14